MKLKYKANYFLATLKGGILFDDKGEFDTKHKGLINALLNMGAIEIKNKNVKK